MFSQREMKLLTDGLETSALKLVGARCGEQALTETLDLLNHIKEFLHDHTRQSDNPSAETIDRAS